MSAERIQMVLLIVVGVTALYTSASLGAGATALVASGCALGLGFKMGKRPDV